MGKCWLQAFSPFPTMFSKGCVLRGIKSQLTGLTLIMPLTNFKCPTRHLNALLDNVDEDYTRDYGMSFSDFPQISDFL